MSDMSAATLLTFAQFEALPEKPGKLELLHGRVIEMPPPKRSHQSVVKKLYERLRSVLEESRVWPDTGYRVQDGWLVPDVSVVWEGQQSDNDYFLRSPMIAVEVISPSNSAEYVDQKVGAYLADGAGEVWVFYPKTHAMTVYTGGGMQRTTTEYRTDILPGLVVSLSEIFS
jgi:Uma2 family endonuclease